MHARKNVLIYRANLVGVVCMGKCPDCMREYHEHKKKWRYGHFDVEAYSCECGTDFGEYKKDGKPSFTLKKQKKGKVWKKA